MSVLAIMSLDRVLVGGRGERGGMGFGRRYFALGILAMTCARTRTTFQKGGRVISKPLGKEPHREKGPVAMHVRRANSPMCFWLSNESRLIYS